jgi:hypothetical protein
MKLQTAVNKRITTKKYLSIWGGGNYAKGKVI